VTSGGANLIAFAGSDQTLSPVIFKVENMQSSSVDEMEEVEVTGGDVDRPPLMTEQEKRILEMYDRLEELQLEIALLQARGVLSQGMRALQTSLLLRILTISRRAG
jgi:hypothetical protein